MDDWVGKSKPLGREVALAKATSLPFFDFIFREGRYRQ